MNVMSYLNGRDLSITKHDNGMMRRINAFVMLMPLYKSPIKVISMRMVIIKTHAHRVGGLREVLNWY